MTKGTGITSVSGAGTYLFEETVSINAVVGTGYTWSKWSGTHSSTSKQYSFTMPASNVSDTANATINSYSISYDLAGGSLSAGNPTSYSVISTTFTLNNPTKIGYTFIGWTGSNGIAPQTTVTIEKGSTGNKSYVANWSANTDTVYKVQHWQQNLDGNASIKNSTNYTLKDTDNLTGTTGDSVTPSIKSYTGFTSPSTQTATIKADGSLVINYYYTRNSYTVSLVKGTGISSVSGTGEYLYGANVSIDATVGSGYTWSKWTGTHSSTTKAYSFTMPASNVSDTANATINKYSITYDLAGGSVTSANPTTYTVETETFTLNNPTKVGYTFSGWTGSNGDTPQTTVSISKGSTGNKSYEANWSAGTGTAYKVQHWQQNLDGNASTHDSINYTLKDTENLTGTTGASISPSVKTYSGFTSPSKQTVTIKADGSLVVNYYYTRNSYTVSLTKGTGISSVSGEGTYKFGANVTINAVVGDGYTWSKWSGTHSTTTQKYSFTMPASDVSDTASATLNSYTISYNLAGGTVSSANPTTYTVETATFTLNNPTKVGYTFKGWTGSNGSTAQTSVSITKGSTGNKSYTASWTANTNTKYTVKHWQQNLTGDASVHDSANYTLKDTDNLTGTTDASVTPNVKNYSGFTSPSTQTVSIKADGSLVVNYYYARNSYTVSLTKGTGIDSVSGVGTYKFGASVTINAVVGSGYTWSKWTGTHSTTTQKYTFTMPASNVSDTANVTLNSYSISYDLAGGSVSSSNPTSYTVETDTFTLNNPTKVGYTFTGWTGSNGSTAQKSVSITKGSTGNKSYVANWSAGSGTAYKVQHWQQNLDGDASVHDSTNYTLKDTENLTGTTGASVNPDVMSYSGFTSPSKQSGTIKADGTLVINYYYTRNSYTVSLVKGTGISSISGSGTYKFGASVSINAVVGRGYTWSKWTGTKTSTTQNLTFTMPASDVSNTANATVNSYNITYDLVGGSVSTENPTTYTVETTTFTLNNPIKVGYTFKGWTGSNGSTAQTSVSIAKGSTGNKSYTANWTANTNTKYVVKHWQQNLDGDASIKNSTNYTLKDTENLTGTTGLSITPSVKTYTGFTSPSTQTVTIKADGSLVVNYYYTRNNYTVTLTKGTGISSVSGAGTYKFGASVSIDASIGSGYTWSKWTGTHSTTTKDYTFTMPASNVSDTANATLNSYSITYDLAGGSVATANPTTYTVETATFTLNNPTKVGYTFSGWTGSNGSTAQTNVSITKGSVGNKSYVANWTAGEGIKYTVKHWKQNLDGKESTHDSSNYTLADTDNLSGMTGASVSPNVKTYSGFTSPSKQTATIKADGSLVINYYYTRNSYTVSLAKGTGINSVSGAGEYKFGANVSISAVVSSGYTWDNWSGTHSTATKDYSFTMPASNVSDTANAVINTYTITYNLSGGSVSSANPTSYTVETTTFTLNNPTKVGYTFVGWTGSNGSTAQASISISKGSTGNKSYVANWTANTNTKYVVKHWQQNLDGNASSKDSTNYTLKDTENLTGTTGSSVIPSVKSYTGFTAPSTQSVSIKADGSLVVNYYYTRNSYTVTLTKGKGITSVSGSGSYLYGTSVTINAVVGDGYDWSKWTGTHSTTTQNYSFTMPASNVSDTANTTTCMYTIDYDLVGGTLDTPNPSSYHVETPTFTLNNPTRVGYTFAGWTGTDVSSPQITVSIAIGSTGNRSYRARWTANGDTKYVVNHWQQKLTGDASSHDSSNYTLKETENLTGTTGDRVDPSVKSYSGFTPPATLSTIIKANGSLVVDYYYTRNSYTVSLTKGTGISSVSGARAYLYGTTVTINATVSPGYTWSKWTGTKESTNQSYSFTMPAANVSNTANATLSSYTIAYDLAGGSVSSANPTTYTVETETFTLNNPTKVGYTFSGWTGSNGDTAQTSVSVTKGSTGNKSYVANWTANTNTAYKVHHWCQNLTGDASSHDSSNYTLTDTDSLTGTTGASVTPSVKTYTGFTSPSTITGTIAADGSLVVDYYYTRNSYTVSLTKGTGISSVSGAGTYLYGASVTINASASSGYVWSKWGGTHSTTTQQYSFTMPASNVSDTANASASPFTLNNPSNATIYAGQSADFTCTVANKGTSTDSMFTYQWQYSKDSGSTWSNYTDTDTVCSVYGYKTRNGYKFRCVVSNGITSVTSTAATLTVNDDFSIYATGKGTYTGNKNNNYHNICYSPVTGSVSGGSHSPANWSWTLSGNTNKTSATGTSVSFTSSTAETGTVTVTCKNTSTLESHSMTVYFYKFEATYSQPYSGLVSHLDTVTYTSNCTAGIIKFQQWISDKELDAAYAGTTVPKTAPPTTQLSTSGSASVALTQIKNGVNLTNTSLYTGGNATFTAVNPYNSSDVRTHTFQVYRPQYRTVKNPVKVANFTPGPIYYRNLSHTASGFATKANSTWFRWMSSNLYYYTYCAQSDVTATAGGVFVHHKTEPSQLSGYSGNVTAYKVTGTGTGTATYTYANYGSRKLVITVTVKN